MEGKVKTHWDVMNNKSIAAVTIGLAICFLAASNAMAQRHGGGGFAGGGGFGRAGFSGGGFNRGGFNGGGFRGGFNGGGSRAGFNGRNQVHTSSLVEAGGNLPVVIIFVDFEEHVSRVLPQLREMPHIASLFERTSSSSKEISISQRISKSNTTLPPGDAPTVF